MTRGRRSCWWRTTRGWPGSSSCAWSGPGTRWRRRPRPRRGSDRVAGGGIDLIVLDQQLTAGTSGLEFFRQVKAAGHNVPAILVTGMQEEGLLVEALRAGVRDFVPKTPNFLNHLEPIVARVLDQVRTERELAESRARRAGQRGAPAASSSTRSPSARRSSRPCARPRRTCGGWSRASRTSPSSPSTPTAGSPPGTPAPSTSSATPSPRPSAARIAVDLHPRGSRGGRPRAGAHRRRRPRPRGRRALAHAQGRQPVLRQRRDEPDLRRGGRPLRLHQGRARHDRAQPRRGGRPRGRRPAQGHRRHGR